MGRMSGRRKGDDKDKGRKDPHVQQDRIYRVHGSV
jgi:hypothetical protein